MPDNSVNSIASRQNTVDAIDLLAASSRAYANVKTIAKLQSFIAGTAALLGGLALLFPIMKLWGTAYSVIVLLVDFLFFEPHLKKYQDIGAKIQEIFDTDVLQIPANPTKVHPLPEPEEIHSLATKFRAKHTTQRLYDWYPINASEVPIEYGRLICQRANMTWDSSLRKAFASIFFVSAFIVGIMAFIVALAMNLEFSTVCLSILLPLTPACVKLIREGRKHQESSSASDRTRSKLQSIWDGILQGSASLSDMQEGSRRLQDEIYERRKNSPTVPEWLYRLQRDQHESEMQYGASQMVESVKAIVKMGTDS